MKTLFLILFLFTVNICAQSDKATVYFYRVKEVHGIANHDKNVRFNDKELFKIKQKQWIGFELPPGNHSLKMRQKKSEILLKLEAGKTYFVRVSEVESGYFFSQSVTLIPNDQGAFQMRELNLLEDKYIVDKSYKALRERPNYESYITKEAN